MQRFLPGNMATVNPNLKSCLNDEEVVVKSRSAKVVDKSRQTTLVSPNVEGAKKKPFEKVKSVKKNPITTSSHKQNITSVAQNVKNLNPVVQNMFPHQTIRPPPHPFPILPAGANPVVDPYTQQIYVPAYIPVPAGSSGITQPLTYLTPMPAQQFENAASATASQFKEMQKEESNRFKDDDKYHSSELDYFLGGAAQYLNERSRRKRSRSFSSHSSSAHTRSDSLRRKKKRRYSPFSRSSFDRSQSSRSYDRVGSQKSRRLSGLSCRRSASVHGSRHYSQSPSFDRSLSRSMSLSPPRSGSCHLNSVSRSPVSENSFRGSFLTVSEANSRDSVRSLNRERSKSHYSDIDGDHFSDIDSASEFEKVYSSGIHVYNESSYASRDSFSPTRDRFLARSPDRSRHRFQHLSPDRRSNQFSHRSSGYGRDFVLSSKDAEMYSHHYRNQSRAASIHDRLERVSDFEDVSDFEEISDLEEISDSDTSITWQEGNSRSQSLISRMYYEAVSDNEEASEVNMQTEKLNTQMLKVTTPSPEKQYDGYLDPRIEKAQNGKKNILEDVSDSEMQLNDSQSPQKEKKVDIVPNNEEEKMSASATSFIQNVLSDITANSVNQEPDNREKQTFSHQTNLTRNSEAADTWNAITNSAVQVYANLGLIKDGDNKFIYVGQEATNVNGQEAAVTLPSQITPVTLDESFQGHVNTLWQFPHKGVLHMSYTNFNDESEAYKDEFVAEIVHIILSLDLPYVTLNKLRNAIREKINIQILSVEELQQILILYPQHFTLRQHTGSDSEEDGDSDVQMGTIHVNVKVEVRLCERHRALPFRKTVCTCNALHICPFYLLSKCRKTECSLGHDLKTKHNAQVLTECRLHRATLAEVVEHLRNVDHRNVDTVPAVCKFYNRSRGCAKESESEDDTVCLELHICFFYAVDSCHKGHDCELAHDIMKGQPLFLLQKFGLDPNKLGEFNVLSLVRTFLRIRRKELEMLHEKLSDKSLSESEMKICLARGINPKLLEMTTNLKGQATGVANSDNTVPVREQKGAEIQNASSKEESAVLNTSDGQDRKGPQKTLSHQMRAQKALVDKALCSVDEKNDIPTSEQADQNAVIPLICKFYNNETGCARSSEMCDFIHVCHHYVMGDCRYNDRCKRSHSLTSGQPESVLARLGLVKKTEDEIIKLLRKLCGETLAGIESDSGSVTKSVT